jgi:hypothetical protein
MSFESSPAIFVLFAPADFLHVYRVHTHLSFLCVSFYAPLDLFFLFFLKKKITFKKKKRSHKKINKINAQYTVQEYIGRKIRKAIIIK